MKTTTFQASATLGLAFAVGALSLGCGGTDSDPLPSYNPGAGGAAGPNTTAGTMQATSTAATTPTSIDSTTSTSSAVSSNGGLPTGAATTGTDSAMTTSAGGTNSVGTSGTVGGGGTGALPTSCAEAAAPFVVTAAPLGMNLNVASSGGGFNSQSRATLPVSASESGEVYVGFNADAGAVVASAAGLLLTTADATLGGVTATNNGVAALYFGETWAQVTRYDTAGEELFSTDLFRSANLDDEGTKGEASSARLGYLSDSDSIVAYFGHTQRYDDGVRHQGGYLASVDSSGSQELLNGWFGSHNLDQRLWTSGSSGAVIGLGDAYPIGIFYAPITDDPRPEVIYRLAAAGNGAANGQLGGIVDLGTELGMPFITNLSVSPDLDAGEWPDIDESVASQIRDAAANGTDMGLLRVPKNGPAGDGDAATVWLAPELTPGARLVRLKSARYGEADMLLLIWAEASGGNRDESLAYYTMVVDAAGAICQPKSPLDSAYAVASGDDIVRGPGGQIYWATTSATGISVITLTPQ